MTTSPHWPSSGDSYTDATVQPCAQTRKTRERSCGRQRYACGSWTCRRPRTLACDSCGCACRFGIWGQHLWFQNFTRPPGSSQRVSRRLSHLTPRSVWGHSNGPHRQSKVKTSPPPFLFFVRSVWLLFIAISAHKYVISFCISMQFVTSGLPPLLRWIIHSKLFLRIIYLRTANLPNKEFFLR